MWISCLKGFHLCDVFKRTIFFTFLASSGREKCWRELIFTDSAYLMRDREPLNFLKKNIFVKFTLKLSRQIFLLIFYLISRIFRKIFFTESLLYGNIFTYAFGHVVILIRDLKGMCTEKNGGSKLEVQNFGIQTDPLDYQIVLP